MRVNVESICLTEGRFRKFTRLIGGNEFEALGRLVFLWHDSQNAMKLSVREDDLMDYLRVQSEEEGQKIIEALMQSKYLSLNSDGTYKVRGNEKHIKTLREIRNRAKKGGQATREKWKREKCKKTTNLSEGSKPSLQAGQTGASKRGQYNTMQSNTDIKESLSDSLFPEPQNAASVKPSDGPVEELKGLSGSDLLSQVSHATQRRWIDTYELEYVIRELGQAAIWLDVNPRRRPKQFPRFFANWLSKGWDRYRKTIPSNPIGPRTDIGQLLAEKRRKD